MAGWRAHDGAGGPLHQQGNAACTSCCDGYPQRCRCGGEVHARELDAGGGILRRLFEQCSGCKSPRPIGALRPAGRA